MSYNEKHNDANGEDSNDGESHNRSWNCGVEGPTDDPEILALRAREQRNLLATLLLTQGVPMLLHGDEMGRTQHGNNNTYAQDYEIAWMHWDDADKPLVEFTAALARAAPRAPDVPPQALLHRRRGPHRTDGAERLNDIVWLHLDGPPDGGGRLGQRRSGHRDVPQRAGHPRARRARQRHRSTTTSCSTSTPTDRPRSTLPPEEYSQTWDVVIDTGGDADDSGALEGGLEDRPCARAACSCSASTSRPPPSPTTPSLPPWPPAADRADRS